MTKRLLMILVGLVLLAPVAIAAADSRGLKAADASLSGSWYDPTHSGEGFNVQFIDDHTAAVFWFTYDENGNQRWFSGVGTANSDVLRIDRLEVTHGATFGPGFDPDDVVRTDVGELSITFKNDSSARANYTINGVAGVQNLDRLTRPAEVGLPPVTTPLKSGAWFDLSHNGEGFAIEILEDGTPVVYWYTYDVNGNQAWMVGVGQTSAERGSFQVDLVQPQGGHFGPDFDPDDVDRPPAGKVRVGLDCNAAYSRFESTDADFVDLDLNLIQLLGIDGNLCRDQQIVTQFPVVNGKAVLPDYASTEQLTWLLRETQPGAQVTSQEITQRFADSWLDKNPVAATRKLITDLQADYPRARYTDPVAVTTAGITGLVTANSGAEAFVVLDVDLVSGQITGLQIFPYGFGQGTVVIAADQNLSLTQAVNKFADLYSQNSLLVARVKKNGQCSPIIERAGNTLRATASIFKIWILAGVADALADGSIVHDQTVRRTNNEAERGGSLFDVANNTPFSVNELTTLMMGVSDNTATNLMHELVGRDRINSLHAEYGHSRPEVLAPQLNVSEQFHLFFSFPLSQSQEYVNGTEAFQRDFLNNRIEPLGSSAFNGGGFNNVSLFISGSWQASPMDICGALARHREHPAGSDEALQVERALGAQAAQPNLREHWDRIWYKGGNLITATTGNVVLTHAWLLERKNGDTFVVVGMANEPSGGIDVFAVQSVLGRVLELVREM